MKLQPGQAVKALRYLGSETTFDAIVIGLGQPRVAGPYLRGGLTLPTVPPKPTVRIRYTSGGEEILDVPLEWIVEDAEQSADVPDRAT